MAATADGQLHVYFLNVGQGDTTVIVTPHGRVMIIDAARPAKLSQFLRSLGAAHGTEIDLLVITHPHHDHYSGAGRLVQEYRVAQAVLCPFWNVLGMGPVSYRQLVADLHTRGARCQFLSGYARFYPDSVAGVAPPHGFARDCRLELLGPSNGLVTGLEQQRLFDTNHLSIMSRITWRNAGMVIAADAQMENWAVFDSERMAGDRVHVLRAAHHGSGNGTQWERLERFRTQLVVVSSDLATRHCLPDVTGAAVLARYALEMSWQPLVALTGDTGTIEVIVDVAGNRTVNAFGDSRGQNVNLAHRVPLTRNTNPTDWKKILIDKANSL